MKVQFHVKEVVLTAKQKSLIEKKLFRLKRYLKDEPLIIDVYLRDETGSEKGGVDQSVELSAVFDNEKIFVREVDDRLMRAFAVAYKSFERQLEKFHRKRIDKTHRVKMSHLDLVLRALRLRK